MKKIKRRVRRKKSPKTKWKEKAWKEFSRFIRLRDSDKNGMVKCCTCESVMHWSKSQAGHFPQGRRNSILFDEQGVHAQGQCCNIFKRGALDIYAHFMVKKYGCGIIEEMRLRKEKSVTYTEKDFENIASKYKRLADIYQNQKTGDL